ncbi:MAG: dTDP-4-dehydrorhamnose 3,5-epimerase [Candidatus Poriferisodalaceae bacterium]|jgi:dTDP-4-dehydrorhamnose 3,5-epimerase
MINRHFGSAMPPTCGSAVSTPTHSRLHILAYTFTARCRWVARKGSRLIFHPTDLNDAWLIEPNQLSDDRGFYARVWCQDEFGERGLDRTMVQGNISHSHQAGTMRGIHYQLPPMMEAKYVRVLSGAIHDVIIDLRPWSSTFGKKFAVELSASNRLGLYVPAMFAHGFLTLADDTEVTYLVSASYTPGLERGMRYDDPTFNISWPIDVSVISDKDLAWPDLDLQAAGAEIADAKTVSTRTVSTRKEL